MSEYAKNIQTINDLWKKRIKLRDRGGGRMSEYIYRSNGEPLANERGEIFLARAGEVVRCRDCKYYRFEDRSHIFNDDRHNDSYCLRFVDGKRMEVEPDGYCAWGEKAVE